VQCDEGGLPRQFRDDLYRQLQLLGGPADQLPGVAGIGPDQPDARETSVQGPQQGSGAVAVLHAGAGDQHGQQ